MQEKLSGREYKKLMRGIDQKMMSFERVYRDEDDKLIEKHMVYKDFMVFFELLERDTFGGRVMLAASQMQKDKKRQQYQEQARKKQAQEEAVNGKEAEGSSLNTSISLDNDDLEDANDCGPCRSESVSCS